MRGDMKDCKWVPLTDLLETIVDNRGKSCPTQETGFPLIATNCIKPTSIYPTFENIRYVSNETLRTWFRAEIKPHDILFVNKGTPGRVCLVPDPVTFCAAQDMVGLRADSSKIYYRYLFAVLRSDFIQEKINNFHVGIAIPHFKKSDMDELLIPVPNMNIQHKIGDLYCKLSEKIEMNNALSSKLESLARMIYDYWFLQFDFPDENGRPYRSSGGKMVWNAELKREIPEGWEVETLKDVLQLISQKVDANNTDGFPYTPMDMLPIRKMTFSEYKDDSEANSSLIKYSRNDILFGAMRPYFHRVCLAPFDGITRTTTFVLRSPIKTLGYAFETMNMDITVAYATLHSIGTQQPYAVWENNLADMKIVKPPMSLKEQYSKSINSIINEQYKISAENRRLASLRDFLLPLLMNGQVTFK